MKIILTMFLLGLSACSSYPFHSQDDIRQAEAERKATLTPQQLEFETDQSACVNQGNAMARTPKGQMAVITTCMQAKGYR